MSKYLMNLEVLLLLILLRKLVLQAKLIKLLSPFIGGFASHILKRADFLPSVRQQKSILNKKFNGAGDLVNTAIASKPDDLSLITRIHIVERTDSSKLSSDLHSCMSVQTCIHVQSIFKLKVSKFCIFFSKTLDTCNLDF